MSYIPGDTVYAAIPVQTPATGAATDADALPTATLWRNGADSGVTVTVTDDAGTGQYTASAAIPGGWSAGDTVEIRAVATVGGVTSPATPVFRAVLDAKRNADLNDAAAAPSADAIKTAMEAEGSTLATIAIDVAGLDGAAMRGTDGANTTVPDAAGTAAGLIGDLQTHGDTAWPTGGDATAANQEALLARLTAARAGLLDNLARLDQTLTALGDAIRGADGDTLETLSGQIDGSITPAPINVSGSATLIVGDTV